jgi:hypothetical protein
MPPKLPQIEPDAASLANHVFIAVTLKDPNPATGWRMPGTVYEHAAPLVIMGWPIRRRGSDGRSEDFQPTPERIEARIAKEQLQAASWRVVQYGEIPKDRTYRDALADVGGMLAHHLPTVKKIALQHLREDRAPLMADLDVQWMRATGQGKKQDADAIEAQRQTLRDKPATVAAALEAAGTIDEILAIVTL